MEKVFSNIKYLPMYKYIFIYIRNNLNRFFKRYIPISCIICCILCFFFLHNFRKIPEVANGEDKSGTTAICVLISENYTIFSNCGDSRGVLSAEGSKPVLVTQVDFSYFKLLSNIEQYYYVLVLPI